jgi:hypothetical protein
VGSVKFLVDGSFHEADQYVGTSTTIRDQQGGLMFTAYRFLIDCEPPFEAELARGMLGRIGTVSSANSTSNCYKLIAANSKMHDHAFT